jgi:hypothetical protein
MQPVFKETPLRSQQIGQRVGPADGANVELVRFVPHLDTTDMRSQPEADTPRHSLESPVAVFEDARGPNTCVSCGRLSGGSRRPSWRR